MQLFTVVIGLSLGAFASAVPTSCPEPFGEQAYAHSDYCDQFFKCTNGTLTLETCENGLLFDGKGAVYNHCNYNWAVDCGDRKNFASDQIPLSTPGCEFQFGIYQDSEQCSTSYIKCEYGVPHVFPCQDGLVYDERIHGCNWPDQLLEKCNPEAVAGFACPIKVDARSLQARFWPYPRFAYGADAHKYIVCVEGNPRLISCGDDSLFDEKTLSCEEIDDE